MLNELIARGLSAHVVNSIHGTERDALIARIPQADALAPLLSREVVAA